jgi:hypothetical protein
MALQNIQSGCKILVEFGGYDKHILTKRSGETCTYNIDEKLAPLDKIFTL